MNFSKLISSFFIILVAIFFMFLGIVCLMTPWIPPIRTHIITFITTNPIALSLFGAVSLGVGATVATNVILNARHRYYRVRSGSNPVDVDEGLIQQYLDTYWSKLFPNCDIPNRLILKKNRIYLIVSLPYIPLSEQKPLLERIEEGLASGLATILGYTQEFYVNASFSDIEPTTTKKT